MQNRDRSLSCLIVGDNNIPQAHLLSAFTDDQYNSSYRPLVWDSKTITHHFQNVPYKLNLADSTGLQNDRARFLQYPGKDMFILFFSYDDAGSLEPIKTKYDELKKYAPNALQYLVGIHGESEQISEKDAIALAEELGLPYFDCESSDNHAEIKNIFNAVFDHAAHRLLFSNKFSKFTFFMNHFSSAEAGLQFAMQVAQVTRGFRQGKFEPLPIEILANILQEAGLSLLRNPHNIEHRIALQALCELVSSNVWNVGEGKKMEWAREHTLFGKTITIYEEPKSKSESKSKFKSKFRKKSGEKTDDAPKEHKRCRLM